MPNPAKERMDLAGAVFGEFVSSYMTILDSADESIRRTKYSFMPPDDFLKLFEVNIQAAMSTYWYEILCRAHLASVTTLLRIRRWLDGVLMAVERDNYFVFAASSRGMIEAATDSFYSLESVPMTLASNYGNIRLALEGKLLRLVSSGELESILIHYSHAQDPRKAVGAPDSHKAKSAKEYREALEAATKLAIKDCYSELCEVTHPSAASVRIFFDADEAGNEFSYRKDCDQFNILYFLETYRKIMPELFQFSLNPALMTLKLINTLSIKDLYMPNVDDIHLDTIPGWKKMLVVMQT